MKNTTPIIYLIIMFLLLTIVGIAQSEYDPQNIIDKTIEKYAENDKIGRASCRERV